MKEKSRFICITLMLLLCQLVNSTDLENSIVFDLPENQILKQLGQVPEKSLKQNQDNDILQYKFEGDTAKMLVVLVHWSNRQGTYSRETFDSLMFSRNVYPGGSVADYFNEVSYGKLTIVGDVLDWYDAGVYDPTENNNLFDYESILPEIDQIVDFSQYDGNSDGNVDILIFVRAGKGQEDTHDPKDYGSFATIFELGSGPGPYDGVRIPRLCTVAELKPLRYTWLPTQYSGLDTLNSIRIACHEIAHNLGFLDLYDFCDRELISTFYTENDNDHPLYDWCLMGYYGYGILSNGSKIPSHFCGWYKMKMGWVAPVELIGEYSDLVIYDIETHKENSLFKVPINPYEGEYFLLEYRNPHSSGIFDKTDSDFSVYFYPDLALGGDTLSQGLLITHVHDSLSDNLMLNICQPVRPNYTVRVIDAGYSAVKDTSFNPGGKVSDSAQWWYPYETRKAATFSSEVPGQEEFSPTTIPNSDGYFGPTGITIRVDSIVNERLYAYVYNPINTDYDSDGFDADDDNCPYISNNDQADFDNDGVGDVCDKCTDSDNDGFGDPGYAVNECEVDNCPDVANPEQTDATNDGIGDDCCCVGMRGNYDGDINDIVDIDDLIFMIDYQFSSGQIIPCPDEGDIAPISNPDGVVDIDDTIAMVAYVFKSGPAPGSCN